MLGAIYAGSFIGSLLVARARAALRESPILLGSLIGIAVVTFILATHFNLRAAVMICGSTLGHYADELRESLSTTVRAAARSLSNSSQDVLTWTR